MHTFLGDVRLASSDAVSRGRFIVLDSDPSLPASLIDHGRLVEDEIFQMRLRSVRQHHQRHRHRWYRAEHVIVHVNHRNVRGVGGFLELHQQLRQHHGQNGSKGVSRSSGYDQ